MILKALFAEWQVWREEQMRPCYRRAPVLKDSSELPAYPLDMWPLLDLPLGYLDEVGVPYNRPTKKYPAAYQPTTIAQYALANWNAYLVSRDDKYREAFMAQADWLVAHEVPVAGGGGWPIPFAVQDYFAPQHWLSAMTQGEGISVLIRAYRLSGNDIYLRVAGRAICTFEQDIRDGGVSVSIGSQGVFFEEVAVYPAAHILNGYLFALFGLYDYVILTGEERVVALIERSLATLHTLIEKFDAGYWSRYDLLFGHMAPLFYHSLHILQLEALARYSGCEHCAALAARWAQYQRSLGCRLHYFVASRIARYRRGIRRVLLGVSASKPTRRRPFSWTSGA